MQFMMLLESGSGREREEWGDNNNKVTMILTLRCFSQSTISSMTYTDTSAVIFENFSGKMWSLTQAHYAGLRRRLQRLQVVTDNAARSVRHCKMCCGKCKIAERIPLSIFSGFALRLFPRSLRLLLCTSARWHEHNRINKFLIALSKIIFLLFSGLIVS